MGAAVNSMIKIGLRRSATLAVCTNWLQGLRGGSKATVLNADIRPSRHGVPGISSADFAVVSLRKRAECANSTARRLLLPAPSEFLAKRR